MGLEMDGEVTRRGLRHELDVRAARDPYHLLCLDHGVEIEVRLNRSRAGTVCHTRASALQIRRAKPGLRDSLFRGRKRIHRHLAHRAGGLARPRSRTLKLRAAAEACVEALVLGEFRQRLHAVLKYFQAGERRLHVVTQGAHSSHSRHHDAPDHYLSSFRMAK